MRYRCSERSGLGLDYPGVEPGHGPSASGTRPTEVQPTPPLPARPTPSPSTRLRLGQPTNRSRTRWGDTPSRPVPRRVAAGCTLALHELTGADRADTDTRRTDAGRSHRTPDTRRRTRGTGHWTRTPGTDTEHRTSDARTPDRRTLDRRTLDTHRTPDAGRVDARYADANGRTRTGRARHRGHRTSGYHGAAETPNRVAVGGTRGARQL